MTATEPEMLIVQIDRHAPMRDAYASRRAFVEALLGAGADALGNGRARHAYVRVTLLSRT